MKNFDIDELIIIFKESHSKSEVAKKLGFSYFNGKVLDKMTLLSQKYNLSMDHFDPTLTRKLQRKFPVEKKICPVCQTEFKTIIGNSEERVTCSYACSNKWFHDQRYTPENRLKISHTLLSYNNSNVKSILIDNEVKYKLNCKFCNNTFYANNLRLLTCSKECRVSLKKEPSDETKKSYLIEREKELQMAHIRVGLLEVNYTPPFQKKL